MEGGGLSSVETGAGGAADCRRVEWMIFQLGSDINFDFLLLINTSYI